MSLTKNIIYVMLIALILLLIPFIASQFVEGWNWSAFDYVFAWVVFAGTGIAYAVISRKIGTVAYKIALGSALLAMFLLFWINAAVGIIGDEEPFNFVYLAILLLGSVIAFVYRFSPNGMTNALFTMATCVILVPIIALIILPQMMMEPPGMLRIFILNAIFALMFAGSGLLFKRVAKK